MKHIIDDHEYKQFMRLRAEHRAKKQISYTLEQLRRVLKIWAAKAKSEAKCQEEAEGLKADGDNVHTLIQKHYENVSLFIEETANDIEKIWAAYIAHDGKEEENA